MKTMLKRTVSLILALSMVLGFIPAAAVARAAGQGMYTLENGYVKVTVSGENGGFAVWTQEGDRLNKDDNNQNLLYHNGEFDTSFTSFQVTEQIGGIDVIREYLFGGDYNFPGSGTTSTPLAITQDATGISAAWTVDGITFTQRIELSTQGSPEHGMVRISYSVHSPRNVRVKARVLLDTALGPKDYAYYEVVDQFNAYRSIENETVLTTADHIPANFFGYDDPADPSIIAYTVNSGDMPYQVAFGHWNNLGSTLFDFAPDPNLTFTNASNRAYETADSAYALYYDLGQVTHAQDASVSTYYGMYSNQHVAGADSVAINATSPTALTLAPNKETYLPEAGTVGAATFPVLANLTNIEKEGAQGYGKIAVAVYTSNGITPLDSFGGNLPYTPGYQNPYVVQYESFDVGDQETTTFYFKALVGSQASYRKVEFRAFSMPESANGELLKENQIGFYSFYILCPGGDGELPSVTFTGSAPNVLYNQGTRRLTLTGTNFTLLEDTSRYTLALTGPVAASTGRPVAYIVPGAQIRFPEPGVLEALLTETMLPGDYKISLEWGSDRPDGIPESLSAPALHVTMSEDRAYRNDVYGVIAVVQVGSGSNSGYQIRSYASEEAWRNNAGYPLYSEALLVFRGEFTSELDALGRPEYTATSLKANDNNGNAVINNPITLNNCVDFDNGTVSVYYGGTGASQKVCVDFDGDLWTSTTRSSIWSGVAALTEIKNGIDYGLVPYNSQGVAFNFSERPITLIWPCGLGIAQTISGMVFNLTYGSLGAMYDTTSGTLPPNPDDRPPVLGHVLSFSAKLDLSFLVPDKKKSEEEKAWDKMQEYFSIEDQNGNQLRDRWNGLDFTTNQIGDPPEDKRDTAGQASVMVDNILYGCGRGYIGFRCAVAVALPGYIDAMPSMKANLAINTIGDWSFAVDGSCKFTTIEMEVSIDIRSHSGVPIPNKLYFFITGFEPGINVDGFGVLWITGGGGGFDNLYDTIFASTGIPPLKILLSVTFDIVKVLSARADLGLSLRGLGFRVSDVKIKYTSIVALERAALEFQWYPGFYFMASVRAGLLGVINGSGYIVVINNDQYQGFVEFFVRAKVSVPSEIPFIGGIEFAQADLGVNNERIWGAIGAFAINIGITYYWGGDFDFGFKAGAPPTFPELLGYEDVPVYYDAETDRTLYMRVGTNFSVAAMAETVKSFDATPVLLSAADATVKSNPYKTDHQVNLGVYEAKSGAFTISFAVPSLANAEALAAQISIGDGPDPLDAGYTPYNLVPYDGSNLNTANSHLTYDEDKGVASLGVTMVNSGDFDRTWYVKTPVASDIVLYSVAPVPEVSTVLGALSGSSVDVAWTGSNLDKLDSVNFYLTTDGSGAAPADAGHYLGTVTQSTSDSITDLATSFPLSQGLPTGDYYIRSVYAKADIVNGSLVSDTVAVSYTNALQPDDPQAVTISNAGDLTFGVEVQNASDPGDYDGYVLNVYELDSASGEYVPTAFSNLVREKQPDGEGNMVLPLMSVGGRVAGLNESGEPAEHALKPGISYKVSATAYKNVYDAGGTTVLYTVSSNEVLSGAEVMRAPTPPVLTIESATPSKILTRKEWGEDAGGLPVILDVRHETYAVSDVAFDVSSDVAVTGTWTLDSDAEAGDFAGFTTATHIDLTGLSDGDHTLTLRGKDADGDSFRFTHAFTVDTQPPKLMLTSPTNGGFFGEDGSLTVAGVSDEGALCTVVVDGVTLEEGVTVAQLGGSVDSDGVFSFMCPVDPSVSSHEVLIVAADEMGNFSRAVCQVQNKGLAGLSGLDIYMDGELYSNRNLRTNVGRQTELTLVAGTSSGSGFAITDNTLVEWRAQAVRGSALVDPSGVLTVAPGSIGYVVGSFKVADGASMTAAATFGAEAFDGQASHLVIGATIGGTAAIGASGAGEGYFVSGDHVSVIAIPSPGYRFVRWSSVGGDSGDGAFQDQYAASTVFVMPDDDVTVAAHFESVGSGSESGDDDYEADEWAPSMWANAGQLVTVILPPDAGGGEFVPYYLVNGTKVLVPLSREEGGRLAFVAPVNGTYGYLRHTGGFRDADGHWALDYITFAAARGLFGGVGEDMFDPEGSMTRAMFVTVLSRLEGIDGALSGGNGVFPDVPSGEWYSPAVTWASQNGIIGGHNDGTFGPGEPITREQMCAIFLRYLTHKGYSPDLIAEKTSFGDEGYISPYALEAVSLCQQFGLIQGKPGNVFDPAANSTRAEACTVFFRLIVAILSSLN